MKKIVYLSLLTTLALIVLPSQTQATTAKPAAPKVWSAATPKDYTPITWAKARGVASFFKAQPGNGYIDYLTVIYLPYNQLRLIASTTPQTIWGEAKLPFPTESVSDLGFAKMVTEQTKGENPDAQFIWNMPFFNINSTTTDLSLALKSTQAGNLYVTSGSRPNFDVAQPRRMLIIDNKNATAQIADFNESTFMANGDQAVEGFAPTVAINDSDNTSARLFVGVRAAGKELVIYCSRGAYIQNASDALLAAGVPLESQMEADGGASATCAYNLPGQYFVEPGRMLPHLMAAFPFLYRGTVINDGVNLRDGPGTKFKSIAKLAKGTPVIVYEEKTGWLRIDQSAQWVSKSLVKKVN